MRNRDKLMLVVSAMGIGAASMIAFGVDASSPGYQYGRINCGPMTTNVIRTQQQCRNCCTVGANSGALSAEQLDNCLGYCAIPCWPCWEEY